MLQFYVGPKEICFLKGNCGEIRDDFVAVCVCATREIILPC